MCWVRFPESRSSSLAAGCCDGASHNRASAFARHAFTSPRHDHHSRSCSPPRSWSSLTIIPPSGRAHAHAGASVLVRLDGAGASGGLVPCESALVLLLAAVAMRRVGLGLVLLVFFSLGSRHCADGIRRVSYLRQESLARQRARKARVLFRWMPVASAAVVLVLGVVMTGVSLGWIRPSWISG